MAQRTTSQDKYASHNLRGQDPRLGRLNQEAEDLKLKLIRVEETKNNLQNNRQLRETQDKFEQQIQALESDKVSLMKRLNMVLSELEKATHEKSEINVKVLEQERMADELKKKLDEVTSLKNVVNRNLQEDLRYERDLNEKLKEELAKFEREKQQLMSKLQGQEQITKEIQRETNAIQANLQRKNEDLKKLEREHEHNMARLRDLNTQLDHLRNQEMQTKTEKRRMEEELEDLTRERNELIRRMNELSDKYEDYVSTMNRERSEIMKANKNHVKLLTAKLLYQVLTEMILWRRKDALQEMKGCAKHIQSMEQKMRKFVRIMSQYGTEKKRSYLRLWYRKAMNFTHENYKKLNLVEFNVNKKRKIKFYYKWRQAFLENRKNYDSKVDSLKVIRNLMLGKQNLQIRRYLCKWRDFVELRSYQQDFMTSIMQRKKLRQLRNGFVIWLADTKRQGLEERYQNMSDLMTSLWFKQRVFLGLRQACLESKTENSMMKFKAWKDWCETSRKKKYFARKKLLVDRLAGTRDERLVKKVFDAIKYHNVNRQYEETKEQLDREIPIREELERKKETLLKVNKTKDKYRLFRQMCIRYADVKYRAIQIWKENVEYYNRTMQRTKLRLIELHKRNVTKAFFKWKEAVDKKHMVELVTFTEDLVNENQELQNTLQACKREREVLVDCSLKQQGSKLERIRNMLNRNQVGKRFYQWLNNAKYVCSLEDALFMTSKTIRRRKLRNAFNKYRQKAKEVKRVDFIINKVGWFGSVRDSKVQENCFAQWKDYIQRYKLAKKFLIRSIKGVDKLIKNEAFGVWKNGVYKYRKQVYLNNIQELERRQGQHDEQIQDLNRQIQINESTQRHLVSKMQSQSHKIMANFISRFIHSSLAKGFYTWHDTLKDHKNKKRQLRSTINFWIKNAEGKAFRKWADFTYKHKEHELSQKLLQKEQERKNLQRIKDEEESRQNKDVDNLSQQLQQAVMLKDQLKANYEKALETHISRIHNNTYVDKRRNIFCVWADYIKKEKNAINAIGALARKNMRMEVFSRIRRAARENYLDARAEKILTSFFRLCKSNVVLHAFSKWRVNAYSHLVNKMNMRQDQLQRTKLNQELELQNMELQKHKKAERILKQKRQREISAAWITMTKRLKAIRVKEELLKTNIRFIQVKFATRKWFQRTQATLFLKRRNQQVIKKYQAKTLFAIFQAWQDRLKIEKLLCQRTVKFVKRMSYLDVAHGFQQIIHFKRSLDERVKERKEHGNTTIYKTLNRLIRHELSDALLTLKNRAFKRDFKEKFLQRAFKHSLIYRMKHFFGRWKHNNERMALAEKINSEGDVVLERNEMRRNVKVLKDFLVKQGYSPEQVEEYLQKKGEQQKSNMQRAIVSLFFKNSEFQIMPKAMNQWKRWVQMRKLCRREAAFIVNGLNHPLFWAFRKWKYSEEIARQKLKDITKTELVDKIVADEIAIGSAQSRIARMDEAIDHLTIQRENLLQHFISGQKLALALGKNNHIKAMFKAFVQWKRETKIYEQVKLAEQLERTNQMIQDLMSHVNRLEGINKNLVVENEELRQAALDGIEIAKAVQELTREREQLSCDLQDRSCTIKKLIDDNNNLSLRLSIAQKEAEQLDQLNQQSYLAPPEREKYY